MNGQQRVTKDMFGRDQILIGLKPAKNKKTGKEFDEIGKGYFEVKGILYKLEISPAKKEGRNYWAKITKMPTKSSSGSF